MGSWEEYLDEQNIHIKDRLKKQLEPPIPAPEELAKKVDELSKKMEDMDKQLASVNEKLKKT